MKRIVTAICAVILTISLLTAAFTFNQIGDERDRYENDLRYRSTVLTENVRETIEPNFSKTTPPNLQTSLNHFTKQERSGGLAVYDLEGIPLAGSANLPASASAIRKLVADTMDENTTGGTFMKIGSNTTYVLASPLHEGKRVVGVLVVAQNATYIDTRTAEIWKNNIIRLLIQLLVLAAVVYLVIHWLVFEPVQSLSASLRLVRTGGKDGAHQFPGASLFRPLTNEMASVRQSLAEARLAAVEEARASLEKMDAPWTADRLREFIRNSAGDRKIIIVSNREPYIHTKSGNSITCHTPASGMVTALEPVVRAANGTWIAHGSGNADRAVVDEKDRVAVPTDNPQYTLHRVWLTEEEEKNYYEGFCNEGLWPLCHSAHTRPIFRKEDWGEYRQVNGKFAKTVLSEIQGCANPIVLIQDFHFALLPRMIKNSRPDATVGLFWHIPWVSAESFSICPWKNEILDGMLGADLLGFHTQLHCNNFIETAARSLEARIDYETFTITRSSHTSFIKPFPISVAFANGQEYHAPDEAEQTRRKTLLEQTGVSSKYVVLGVDRLDYTKGILERLKAIEICLARHPEYSENLTFVQIGAPTRTNVKRYREFETEVTEEVVRINTRFGTRTWKPVVFIERHHTHEEINRWYRIANACLVTSLHDGMNLVAKEYVAARDDNKGVLILSQFAGASKELSQAIIVNPYNGEETAEAIHSALSMPLSEQTKRMSKLRDAVRHHNVYRWSAEFLRTLMQA